MFFQNTTFLGIFALSKHAAVQKDKHQREIKTEEELQKFESEIIDRFGELPTQVQDLFDSVRLKWIATKMGLEKVIMKKGKLIGYFIQDQQSKFYQSNDFSSVLQFLQMNASKCKMKEKQTRNGLRLLITFERINNVSSALKALQPIMA